MCVRWCSGSCVPKQEAVPDHLFTLHCLLCEHRQALRRFLLCQLAHETGRRGNFIQTQCLLLGGVPHSIQPLQEPDSAASVAFPVPRPVLLHLLQQQVPAPHNSQCPAPAVRALLQHLVPVPHASPAPGSWGTCFSRARLLYHTWLL